MKKLNTKSTSKITGGASDGRCIAMANRWQRREQSGGRSTARLRARIEKNCSGRITLS